MTSAAACTVVGWAGLNQAVKEKMRELFTLQAARTSLIEEEVQEDESNEEELVPSQAYPQFSQAQTENTLKSCNFCDFITRHEQVLKIHMKDHHFKCNLCEIVSKNKEDLTLHTERAHATFNCNICKKAVEVTKVVDHMNMHNTKDRFNQVLSEAPPKKKRSETKRLDSFP